MIWKALPSDFFFPLLPFLCSSPLPSCLFPSSLPLLLCTPQRPALCLPVICLRCISLKNTQRSIAGKTNKNDIKFLQHASLSLICFLCFVCVGVFCAPHITSRHFAHRKKGQRGGGAQHLVWASCFHCDQWLSTPETVGKCRY